MNISPRASPDKRRPRQGDPRLRRSYGCPTITPRRQRIIARSRSRAPCHRRKRPRRCSRRKTAVCEGYARPMVALGKAAGVEIAYITGYTRDTSSATPKTRPPRSRSSESLDGYLHAWNAAKIDGKWMLVDATWDDPVSKSAARNTVDDYLFTPPRAVRDAAPAGTAARGSCSRCRSARGEFVRRPLLAPDARGSASRSSIRSARRSRSMARSSSCSTIRGRRAWSRVCRSGVARRAARLRRVDVRRACDAALRSPERQLRGAPLRRGLEDRETARLFGSVAINRR